jgi:hypothetical protein
MAARAAKPSSSRIPNRLKAPNGNHEPTPQRLMQFAWGYAAPLILEAAIDCRVFDFLDESPQTVEELAAQTGASVRGLRAILNALVGFELLARRGARYRLTPESAAFLVSTKPSYHGAFFRHMCRQVLPNWMQLTKAVRTGRPAVAGNQESTGAAFFAEFVEGLFPLGFKAGQVLGEHLGIPRAPSPVSVLDIGAGSGVWGIALALQSPLVTVQAVDWPAVIKVTKRVAKRHGVQDRLKTTAGDLLKADFGKGGTPGRYDRTHPAQRGPRTKPAAASKNLCRSGSRGNGGNR